MNFLQDGNYHRLRLIKGASSTCPKTVGLINNRDVSRMKNKLLLYLIEQGLNSLPFDIQSDEDAKLAIQILEKGCFPNVATPMSGSKPTRKKSVNKGKSASTSKPKTEPKAVDTSPPVLEQVSNPVPTVDSTPQQKRSTDFSKLMQNAKSAKVESSETVGSVTNNKSTTSGSGFDEDGDWSSFNALTDS